MRRTVGLAVCALIAFGGCGGNQAEEELADARAKIKEEKSAARATIKEDQREAETELEDLEEKAAEQKDELRAQKRKVAAERRRLNRLENQVSGARAEAEKNTIPGTGTFEIGTDVNPGTYRAEAQPGCYWARLSSLDTSDIINNDNADGPVIIEILASDKAIQTNGCADFRKSG